MHAANCSLLNETTYGKSLQSKLEVFDSNIFPLMHTATLCLHHTYCARQSFVGTQETVSVWEMQTPQPQTVQFCNVSH